MKTVRRGQYVMDKIGSYDMGSHVMISGACMSHANVRAGTSFNAASGPQTTKPRERWLNLMGFEMTGIGVAAGELGGIRL